MENLRIAVTSRSFSRHKLLRRELLLRFPEAKISFNDAGVSLSGDDLVEFLWGHDWAITGLEKLDKTIFCLNRAGAPFDSFSCPCTSNCGGLEWQQWALVRRP